MEYLKINKLKLQNFNPIYWGKFKNYYFIYDTECENLRFYNKDVSKYMIDFDTLENEQAEKLEKNFNEFEQKHTISIMKYDFEFVNVQKMNVCGDIVYVNVATGEELKGEKLQQYLQLEGVTN